MSYLPLSPGNERDRNTPAISRPKQFRRKPAPFTRRASFDELPLISLPSDVGVSSNKQNLTSGIVDLDEVGSDAPSRYEHHRNLADLISLGRSSLASSLQVQLKSTYRYIRASGPAKSQAPHEHITEDAGSQYPTGWRLGTWICCSAVILCIIVEVTLLIYATRTSSSRGSGILMEGSCMKIREVELWLLLPLNIVGTVLLGTSNYVMQVLSAPERNEIDRAHNLAQSVAVGGMRFNNMMPDSGNKLRRSIWWTLGVTSLPIHFFLNAAFYSSVQASNTGVVVVSDDFDEDSGWDYCSNLPSNATSTETLTCSLYQNYTSGQTLPMTTSQCLRQYSNGFQTNASSVIVVTSQDSRRWYTIPLTASVPSSVSYGIPCLAPVYNDTNDADCPTGYSEPSSRNYSFQADPIAGNTTISLDFIPFCQYTNHTENCQYSQYEYLPTERSSGNLSYTSYDDLYLKQNDSLAEITSIKALFSAFQYRYWAVADVSGEYLRSDYADLLQNRDPRAWLCPRDDLERNLQCDPLDVQQRNEWVILPTSVPVQGCHVLPKKELCTLHFSSDILVITILFDVIKLSAMVAAVILISKPLTTLGDIIESFLRYPDPHTVGRNLLDDDSAGVWTNRVNLRIQLEASKYIKDRFGVDYFAKTTCDYCGKRRHVGRHIYQDLMNAHKECGRLPFGSHGLYQFGEHALTWLCDGGLWWSTVSTDTDSHESRILKRHQWVDVPSKSRWIWFVVLYLPALILAIVYFGINFRSVVAQRLLHPWTVGFDAPDPNSLLTGYMSGTTNIYIAAMLINAPQVAFSLLYFIFNATLTMMHTAHEWASFSVHRKALRVSSPRGQQRTTYWLQLPWSYSIPLIAISGSMHWLLSRSLYIVKVDVYGYLGEREMDEDYFACGYSPIPALLLVVILTLMGVSLLALSFRWLPGGMQLVRLNSLAIAAACHANPDEMNIELQALMWGELEGCSRDGQPRYSFSARPVLPLETHPKKKRRAIVVSAFKLIAKLLAAY